MITNNILGIVFANSHDALLGELTKHRSMASLPYGGRYRLIDFSLSNLSNAGVDKVGVITKANYYSLMTHLGNGKPWDLDRKNGGLSILPPYASPEAQVYKGRLEAIYGILEYLLESEEELVVLYDSDVVANVDLRIKDMTASGTVPVMNAEMTAANFGNVSDVATKADIAKGISNLVYETVGMVSVFASRSAGVTDIVLTGNLTRLDSCQTKFEEFNGLGYGVRFVIPEYSEFSTAIGCALSALLKTE